MVDEILPYLDDYAEFMNEGPGKRLLRRYWDIDPEVVVGEEAPLCLRSGSGELIRSLGQEEIVDAIGKGGRVAEAVLGQRLDVLENWETWNSEIAELARDALPRLLMWISRGRLCLHFVEASRGDLADTVCEEFGSELVFDAALSVPGDQAEVARRYAEKAFFLMEDRKKVVTNTLGRAGVKVDRNLIHLSRRMLHQTFPSAKVE